jgi:Uma2 family endonuclease
MATVSDPALRGNPRYPTSDGKPMAETDYHRDLMIDLIQSLRLFYDAFVDVYVSGNILLYYVPGDRRRHVSPDVLVVKGVPKVDRINYIVWEEGKAPDLVIELTSSSTRKEDVTKKFKLYQDVLKVSEYFLFDPLGDYLDPALRGYRLRNGKYQAIRPVKGRLPSRVLGLHLEGHGKELRLFNPATGEWLPTLAEVALEEREARLHAEAELARLRQQLAGKADQP